MRLNFCFAVSSLAFAATAAAQPPNSQRNPGIEDPDIKTAVTSYAIRYNKLVMSNPERVGANYIPTGTYKNSSGLVITVNDGLFETVKINPIVTVAVKTTSLNAERRLQLAGQVTSGGVQPAGQTYSIASGTYVSADGKHSFTIVDGKPTRFSFTQVTTNLTPVSPTNTTTEHR